jgi:hypothetical protein
MYVGTLPLLGLFKIMNYIICVLLNQEWNPMGNYSYFAFKELFSLEAPYHALETLNR